MEPADPSSPPAKWGERRLLPLLSWGLEQEWNILASHYMLGGALRSSKCGSQTHSISIT